MSDTDQFFPYQVDLRWMGMLFALGVRRGNGVTITADEHLVATFGSMKIKTPIVNIEYTEVTGPHRWYTAVGLRLSKVDDGITFGTNHRLGLCIAFVEPVTRVIGRKQHSGLWVSVADPTGLAEAIGV